MFWTCLFFVVVYWSQVKGLGHLEKPIPRNYYDADKKSSIINNNDICDNYEPNDLLFTTLKEGENFDFSFNPIFYPPTTRYNYYLCIPSNNNNFNNCLRLSPISDGFILESSQFNNDYIYWPEQDHITSNIIQIPNNILSALTIEENEINAIVIFEWILSEYKVIRNCADVILKRGNNDNINNIEELKFSVYSPYQPTNVPKGVCKKSESQPDGEIASYYDECFVNGKICNIGECCISSINYCSEYSIDLLNSLYLTSSKFYKLYDKNTMMLDTCIDINPLRDNRYITNNKLFIDMCWLCNKNDPNECNYNTMIGSNNYDLEINNNINKVYADDKPSTTSITVVQRDKIKPNITSMFAIILISVICGVNCCIMGCLLRIYTKHNQYKNATSEHLIQELGIEGINLDDLSQQIENSSNKREITKSIIEPDDVVMQPSDSIEEIEKEFLDENSVVRSATLKTKIKNKLSKKIINNDNDMEYNQFNDDDVVDDIQPLDPVINDDRNQDDDESLPIGWKTFYTDDGDPYYYNEATDQTQWEKPE